MYYLKNIYIYINLLNKYPRFNARNNLYNALEKRRVYNNLFRVNKLVEKKKNYTKKYPLTFNFLFLIFTTSWINLVAI